MNIEGLTSRINDWGLLRTLYWYFMTLVQQVFCFRIHHVFINPRLSGKVVIPLRPGYAHRDVSPAELIPYAAGSDELGEELDSKLLNEFSERGDVCVASFFGEELVGFSFSSTTRAPVTPQLEVIVPPGFRYGYKSWTHPDHRRKKLSLGRTETKRSRELISIYYIETHNYPSLLRPYRHPSSRRVHMGYVGWIEFLGRDYPFASRRAKWVGCEFVRRSSTFKRLYTER